MSREEYLNQLHKYLRKLPRQDYEDAMEYFTEYFQETDEEGAEELMKELGTPKEAASSSMRSVKMALCMPVVPSLPISSLSARITITVC